MNLLVPQPIKVLRQIQASLITRKPKLAAFIPAQNRRLSANHLWLWLGVTQQAENLPARSLENYACLADAQFPGAKFVKQFPQHRVAFERWHVHGKLGSAVLFWLQGQSNDEISAVSAQHVYAIAFFFAANKRAVSGKSRQRLLAAKNLFTKPPPNADALSMSESIAHIRRKNA